MVWHSLQAFGVVAGQAQVWRAWRAGRGATIDGVRRRGLPQAAWLALLLKSLAGRLCGGAHETLSQRRSLVPALTRNWCAFFTRAFHATAASACGAGLCLRDSPSTLPNPGQYSCPDRQSSPFWSSFPMLHHGPRRPGDIHMRPAPTSFLTFSLRAIVDLRINASFHSSSVFPFSTRAQAPCY